MTHQRKFPLLIHVDDFGTVILGKTCRFCTPCEFIIADQEELEGELAFMFSQRKPEVIGNDYLVFGVVERKSWQQGLQEQLRELREHTADIKQHMTLLDPRRRWVYRGATRPA